MSYVVIRDPRKGGNNHPTKVYTVAREAIDEAARLASMNRGTTFFICSITHGVELPMEAPRLTEYGPNHPDPWDDEVPF